MGGGSGRETQLNGNQCNYWILCTEKLEDEEDGRTPFISNIKPLPERKQGRRM